MATETEKLPVYGPLQAGQASIDADPISGPTHGPVQPQEPVLDTAQSDPITSSVLADTPDVPFVPPAEETPVDVVSETKDKTYTTPNGAVVDVNGNIIKEAPAPPAPNRTSFADEVEQMFADIQDINKQTADLETFTAQKEEEEGLTEATKNQRDKIAQAKALGLESQNLLNQLNLVEARVQEESLGRGRTTGGISPLTAGRRRTIALAQADVASRALIVQAELYAIEGQVATAKDAVNRAIEVKYGPLMREKDNLIENLNLLNTSGILSREESKRAEEQLKRETAAKEAIQEAKDLEESLEKLVVENAFELNNVPNGSQIMENIKGAGSVVEGVQMLTSALGERFAKQRKDEDRMTDLDIQQAEASLAKTRAETARTNAAIVTERSNNLTPFEKLSSRNLSVEIFGKRAGTKPENVGLIEDLVSGGMNIDEIKDNLRYEGQSIQFSGTVRDAAESIGFGMTADKQERFFNSVDRSIEDGDMTRVKETLIKGALDSLGTEEARKTRGDLRAVELFEEIEGDLLLFASKNGDTGIFKGTNEKVTQKIGKTTNPELAEIANKIQIAIQKYRQAVSGAAFSESESKEYKAIFPSIDKTSSLNVAKITGAKNVLEGNANFTLSSVIGASAYDELFGENAPTGSIQDDIILLSPEQLQSLQEEGLI